MEKEVITPSVVKRALEIFSKQKDNDIDELACMTIALKETFASLSKYKGYHRPVCPPCQVEMRPERNGVGLLDYADFGPYQLWDTDLWECPKCHHQIVIGFGDSPMYSHWESSFPERIQSYKTNSILIENH